MIRHATQDEATLICSYADSVIVLEAEDEIIGQLCLSKREGGMFGHDMKVESDDPRDAFRLWKFAHDWLKGNDHKEVFFHSEDGTDSRILDMWKKLGAEPVVTLYRLIL